MDCREVCGLSVHGGSREAACAGGGGMYTGGPFLRIIGPPGESKLRSRSRELSSIAGACLGGGGIQTG